MRPDGCAAASVCEEGGCDHSVSDSIGGDLREVFAPHRASPLVQVQRLPRLLGQSSGCLLWTDSLIDMKTTS